MFDFLQRQEILLGKEANQFLSTKSVFIAGVGGVGGYVLEVLARAGIGKIIICDADTVDISNINRQIISLHSNIGQEKVTVAARRAREINPEIEIIEEAVFIEKTTAKAIPEKYRPNFFADCIDTIAVKVELIAAAQKLEIPLISSMGAGNCIDVRRAKITKLNNTKNCPLAREVRRHLRKLGANLNYDVVYTDEIRRKPAKRETAGKTANGTISYMPAIFGIMLGGYIVQEFLKEIGIE